MVNVEPSYTDSLRADILPSYDDFLMHHGIKGMHWGIRRFQNEDGSLTDAGLRRYSDEVNRQNKRERIAAARNSSQLSDEELNAMINRLQKEKQLKDLTDQAVTPIRKRGKDFVLKNSEVFIASVATAATGAYVTNKITNSAKYKSKEDRINDKLRDLEIQREAEDRAVDSGIYKIDNNGKLKRVHKPRS